MRVLFGAAGRLGTAVRRTAPESPALYCHGLGGGGKPAPVDLAFADPVIPEGTETVINCAAMSAPGDCRRDPAAAFRVNSLWPRRLAVRCAELGIGLIHMSTDLVWSGGIPPYGRSSPAVPMSLYGWTKLIGDILVRRAHPGALVVRTSVLVGETGARRPTFSEEITSGAVSRFYTDSIRHHTRIMPMAETLHRLAGEGASGLILAASPLAMSRLAFAATMIPEPKGIRAPRGVPLNLTMRVDVEVV